MLHRQEFLTVKSPPLRNNDKQHARSKPSTPCTCPALFLQYSNFSLPPSPSPCHCSLTALRRFLWYGIHSFDPWQTSHIHTTAGATNKHARTMFQEARIRRGGRHTTNSAGPVILAAILLLVGFAALSLMLPREQQEESVEGQHRCTYIGSHDHYREKKDNGENCVPYSVHTPPTVLRASMTWSASAAAPSPWHHKTLWPLDRRDIATLALATCGLVIAAGGGIGGEFVVNAETREGWVGSRELTR